MKKLIYLIIITLMFSATAIGQKHITKNGHIQFYSHAALEDIEAHNHQVNSALDVESGDLVFKVLIKSFEFEKALMQEHFNENYMESDKYPNAVFKGQITNLKEIDFTKDGKYDVLINGDLTIHGVTNKIETGGSFTIGENRIKGQSVFSILLKDYDIKIPKAVTENIAEEIEVTVNIDLKPLK